MTLKLVTLEGNKEQNKPGSLNFLSETGSYALFGDSDDSFRFRVSLQGDEIEVFEWSPLYKKHLPFNDGIVKVHSTLEGEEEGVFWHIDKNLNLLGCSVCVSGDLDTLDGDEEENWLHFNTDGTLAGYSIAKDSGDLVTLSGGMTLDGFGFKGMKMPSFKGFKFKAPKLKAPKLPKFKAPKLKIKAPKIKFKAPKINTKGISKSISSVGKGVSNAVNSVSKGYSNVGNQIGKGVNKYFSNISEGISKVGEIANQALTTATDLLAPGGEEMPAEEEEEQTEEEQITDPTVPGYKDDDGYTDEDGLYYTNDGTLYQNPETGEWFNIDGTPYGQETEEQVINEAVEVYGEMDENAFMTELGFDLSSLASSPLVSTGMNALLPGSGMALSMFSQGAKNAKAKKAAKKITPSKIVSNLKTLNKLTTAKKTRRPVSVVLPKKAGSVARPPAQNTELLQTIKALNTNQESIAKEDKTKTYLMYGGGAVGVGLLFYLVMKKGA